jgi:hypothetical protein
MRSHAYVTTETCRASARAVADVFGWVGRGA